MVLSRNHERPLHRRAGSRAPGRPPGAAGAAGRHARPAQRRAMGRRCATSRAPIAIRTPAAVADYLASTRGTVSHAGRARGQGLPAARGQPARRALGGFRPHRARGRKAAQQATRCWPWPRTWTLRSAPRSRAFAACCNAACTARSRATAGAFGACLDCRHFLRQANPGAPAPHHCGLLDVALSDAESRLLCVEQEPLAA